MNRERQSGFSLIEVLIVLLIFSGLTIIMMYTTSNMRSIGVATQNNTTAMQQGRIIANIMERDVRLIGAELFENTYYLNQGNTESVDPQYFNYELISADLSGIMVPPLEITNGTDTEINSFSMPLDEMMGLTSEYREPNTDLLTLYYGTDTGFNGTIDEYTGVGQENFVIQDEIVGNRVQNIFDQLGNEPILVLVIDEKGEYSTFRTVTNIAKNNTETRIKMEPSNAFNQPSNFKGFIQERYPGVKSNEVPGYVRNDTFMQVEAVSYFVYSHPDAAMQARGWLIRLDLAAVVAGELTIDAADPETLRPFIIAENVSDFQVAMGIDSNTNGDIEASEWINDENMENYTHTVIGGTPSAAYEDMVNNLRAVRFSVVSHTNGTAENDPYGFADPNSSTFTSSHPDVGSVARYIGITPNLEDRTWSYTELVDRLWYRKAVQLTKAVVIRNLDLENTFARVK